MTITCVLAALVAVMAGCAKKKEEVKNRDPRPSSNVTKVNRMSQSYGKILTERCKAPADIGGQANGVWRKSKCDR